MVAIVILAVALLLCVGHADAATAAGGSGGKQAGAGSSGGNASAAPSIPAKVLRQLPSDLRDSKTKLALVPVFKAEAKRYGVPADLLMSLAYVESGWRSQVVSRAGAVGVCQLLPTTATWVAENLIGRQQKLSLWRAEENIRLGAAYLRHLIKVLKTERLAVAAYFDGHGTVKRTGVSAVAARYVKRVQAGRAAFGQL